MNLQRKRSRAVNFNSEETNLLVSYVEKYKPQMRYKHIIENRKTDAVTNKEKEKAWLKIENSFNASGSVFRSWKTLKSKYDGIKKTMKKKSSKQRQEMYKTGGGPSEAPDFNYAEEKVLNICFNIKGLDARYDCDTTLSNTTGLSVCDETQLETQESDTENIIQEITIDLPDMDVCKPKNPLIHRDQVLKDIMQSMPQEQTQEDNESENENKWERWHPKTLKSKVTDVLKSKTCNKYYTSTTQLDKLSKARLELVQLQIEMAREEHKTKMEHLVNEERRKQEIHELLKKRLEDEPLTLNNYIIKIT